MLRDYIFVSPVKHGRHIGIMSPSMSLLWFVSLRFGFGRSSGPPGVYLLDFFCYGIQFYLLLSPNLCFISFLYLDLYVLGDCIDKLGVFHGNQISMCLDPHLNWG